MYYLTRTHHKISKNRGLFRAIYFVTLLLSLHYVLVVYINSTFLDTFTTEKVVGLLYTAGSIGMIVTFLNIARILKRIGNYRLMLILTVLEIGVLLGLAFSTQFLIIIPLFIAHLVIAPLLLYNLDLFLESLSEDATTGNTRGIFLTVINTAFVIAPLIVGLILTNGDFWKIYLLSALFLIPLIVFTTFRKFKKESYDRIAIIETTKLFWKNSNCHHIFFVNFFLHFFYAWMVIYLPIYLYEHLLFSWKEIGIMFAIMLLPFVLLEIPLGKIADKKLGEKELLIIGFIIAGIFSITLSLIPSKDFLLWSVLLFVTRIGASAIEIMSESYFFKQVTQHDSDLIAFFRIARPLAFVVAPVIGSLILIFLPFSYLFSILGIILITFGIYYSARIKDTH